MEISQAKRRGAFQVWKDAFEKFDVDLAAAGAPFRKRWQDSPEKLPDDLVVAGDVLWGAGATHTEKSRPVFAEKVRGLVYSRTEDSYLLSLSELEVPALLARWVSPIAFEPAVPESTDPGSKPRSSDHSLKLPCGEIFLEATTIDLRNIAADEEAILKRIKRKLYAKKQQALRDRVYVIALKVLGQPDAWELVRRLVARRIWPNPQFSRHAGILAFRQDHRGPGRFDGAWLPNRSSTAPPPTEVDDLFCGRRCFHLARINKLDASKEDTERLRRRVAAHWPTVQQVSAPVTFFGGPLDGLKVLLEPTRVGDRQVTYVWDLRMTLSNKGREVEIPPHGPIEIAYERISDTRYEFRGFRFWLDDQRPDATGSEYLLELNLSA